MVVLLSSSTSLFVGVVKLLYYRGNQELVTTYRITEKKRREKRLSSRYSVSSFLPLLIVGEHTDALTTNGRDTT